MENMDKRELVLNNLEVCNKDFSTEERNELDAIDILHPKSNLSKVRKKF